jgi:hypothetical protein
MDPAIHFDGAWQVAPLMTETVWPSAVVMPVLLLWAR